MATDDQLTPEEIVRLVKEECAMAAYIPLTQALAPFFVQPFVRRLRWPYSSEQTEFPCWIVADLGKKKSGLALAYCEFGHGERGDRWGIIAEEDEWLGADDSWFTRLEDAFITAGMWSQPLPASYEVR